MAGIFILTMAGVLLFAFKKNKEQRDQTKDSEAVDEDQYYKAVSSFSDKLSRKFIEAENKLKINQADVNIPSGEFGLFL